MTVNVKTATITIKRGMDRLVFQFSALKLGYCTRLNIINERNSSSGGNTNFHLPNWCSPAAHHKRNNVIDAIRPAAAGIGNQVKLFSGCPPLRSGMADTVLNR